MSQDLDDLLAQIQQEVPGARVEKAQEVQNAFRVRRPTGIADLDVAIGGGLPAGGITELWGPDNSGKNLLSNLVIRQNQRIHGDASVVGVFGIELAFDKTFARKCGVRVGLSDAEIQGLETETGYEFSEEERDELQAQTGQIRLFSAKDAESALEALYMAIASDIFDVIVFDSVAQLIPHDEAEAKMMDAKMLAAKLPQVMARFFRKTSDAYFQRPNDRPNLTTVIMTNQITAKIGGFTRPGLPPPVQMKAGYAMKHAKLLSLKLRAGTKIKDGKEVVGHEVHWQVSKGKAGCADGAAGAFNMYTTDESSKHSQFGPNFESPAFRAALNSGVITKAGAFYEVPHLEMRHRGKQVLIDRLTAANPEWMFEFWHEIMRANGIHAYTDWVEEE